MSRRFRSPNGMIWKLEVGSGSSPFYGDYPVYYFYPDLSDPETRQMVGHRTIAGRNWKRLDTALEHAKKWGFKEITA